MSFLDVGVGIAGLAIGIYGIVDGRRQRNKRESISMILNELIERQNGFLIGFKPALQSSPLALAALNDSIEAIKLAKQKMSKIQGTPSE